MKKVLSHSIFAIALLAGSMTIAAPTTARADSETFGTLGGAAAGGLIGNQFGKGGGNIAATVGGVIAGGIIGNAIGRDADESRPRYYSEPAPRAYYPPPRRTVIVERRPPPVVVYERPYHPHRHYRYYSPYRGY